MLNMFASNVCWEISCLLPVNEAIILSDALDEHGFTSSCFEDDAEQAIWHLKIFIEENEDVTKAEKLIAIKAQELGLRAEIKVIKLDDVDWVSETQKKFKPFSVGKFYIHSSYYKDDMPDKSDKIAIEIDAKQAFGTGEHETTTGCLQILSDVSDTEFSPNHILDMGCGSAILAIAAAKIWPNAVIVAADIEPASVAIAAENFNINSVENKRFSVQSDGYSHKTIHEYAPYDLILSNILATPLIHFAPALKLHLKKNGKAILSGLLDTQKEDVLTAHQEQNLRQENQVQVGRWPSLLLS